MFVPKLIITKAHQEILVSVQSQSWQGLDGVNLERVIFVSGLNKGDPDSVQLVVDRLQAVQDGLALAVQAFATIF